MPSRVMLAVRTQNGGRWTCRLTMKFTSFTHSPLTVAVRRMRGILSSPPGSKATCKETKDVDYDVLSADDDVATGRRAERSARV